MQHFGAASCRHAEEILRIEGASTHLSFNVIVIDHERRHRSANQTSRGDYRLIDIVLFCYRLLHSNRCDHLVRLGNLSMMPASKMKLCLTKLPEQQT